MDALNAITHKREHAEGAALFWILPARRNRELLRLLVTSQAIGDFLDSVSEREALEESIVEDRHHVHRALVEALDPDAPVTDYYRFHSQKGDGAYLRALVDACRQRCAVLPSYLQVRAPMLRGAARCSIQEFNHDPNPARREAVLSQWASREYPADLATNWFELTAAAGAFTPHVFLALATEPATSAHEVATVDGVYTFWFALAIAMLDSYIDQCEDTANGEHSYISHYDNHEIAVNRLREIVARITHEAHGLGNRHAIITAAMVAMYLSSEVVGGPQRRIETHDISHAGSSLTRFMVPVLRIWRASHVHEIGAKKQPRTEDAPPKALPGESRSPSAVQAYLCWRKPLAYLEERRGQHGSRFTYRQPGRPPLVFLSDQNEIKTLFRAPANVLHPGEGGEMILPIVGANSFMLLDEDDHLQGRKSLLPAFHGRAVKNHTEMVRDLTQREIATWRLDTPFALHPHLRGLTLRIILHTIFASTAHDDQRLSVLHERLLAALSITASAVLPEPLLRHGPGNRIWRRFLTELAEVDELIFDLIKRHQSTNGGAGDVLSMLLAARNTDGSPMSVGQVRDNIMSVILAGHETTSSQLAWAFQLLAHHPRVLTRLIDEIDHEGGEEYLTATIQEVLRHRPVFLFAIPRAVKQPIEVGSWTYHPPTHLVACIYLVHHDPLLYLNPDEFRPDRFLDSAVRTYSWLPWGGGPKRCLGLNLAMLEMKTVLQTVLSNLTVDPAGKRMERARWRSVIVTPHAGSRVVLRRRRSAGRFDGGRGCSVFTAKTRTTPK